MSVNRENNLPPEEGDIIECPWYGPARVGSVEPSGHCVKLTYTPLEEPWRVPNPPAIDYFRLPRKVFRRGRWIDLSSGEKATRI